MRYRQLSHEEQVLRTGGAGLHHSRRHNRTGVHLAPQLLERTGAAPVNEPTRASAGPTNQGSARVRTKLSTAPWDSNTTRGLKERSSPHSSASPGSRTSAGVPTRSLFHRQSTLFRVTIDVTWPARRQGSPQLSRATSGRTSKQHPPVDTLRTHSGPGGAAVAGPSKRLSVRPPTPRRHPSDAHDQPGAIPTRARRMLADDNAVAARINRTDWNHSSRVEVTSRIPW